MVPQPKSARLPDTSTGGDLTVVRAFQCEGSCFQWGPLRLCVA